MVVHCCRCEKELVADREERGYTIWVCKNPNCPSNNKKDKENDKRNI